MNFHSSIRLRRWLPILIIGPVLVLLGVSAGWQDWQEMRSADVAVRTLIKNRLWDERNQIEYLLRIGDHGYLSEQISQFSAVQEIVILALVNGDGRVVQSYLPSAVGGRVEEVLPEFDWVRLRKAEEERRQVLEFDKGHRNLLAYQPVSFPAEVGGEAPGKTGAILLKYDLASGKELSRQRVITSTLWQIGFTVGLIGVLMLILRRWLSLPLLQLEAVLNRISQGDFVTRIQVSGSGELAKLGKAIAHMQANLAAAGEARDRNMKALQESEMRFRVLFEQAAIGVAQIESNSGRFVRVNRCYTQLTGYSPEEILELDFKQITHPDDLPEDLANMQRLISGEIREFSMEKRLLRKDGSPLWVSLTVSSMWESGQDSGYHIAIVQDITKRRMAEEALRDSESRYAMVVSAVFEGVISQGRNGEITTWNPAAERILGLSGAELQGRTSRDPRWKTIYEDGTPMPWEEHPSMIVLRTGVPQLGRQLGVHKPDGTLTWLSVNAVPVFESGEKEPSSVVVSFADVTERRKAEDAVRRSERFLRTIIDTEPECVKIMDAKGNLIDMNAAGLAMLEASSPNEVSEYGVGKFILPEHRAGFAALHQKVMGGGTGLLEFEIEGLRGTRRWLETHAAPLRDDAGRVALLLGITRDITARKQTEEALRESVADKEALLREVHHRVKNNLQVIVSLLRMEGSRSSDPGTKFVLKDMQGRIQSMALLHELLYRSGTFATVDLAGYIRQVVTHVFRALVTRPGSIELSMDLAPVSLKMDQAMPCGLLVNELLSNCIKHAFPDDRNGTITVRLRLVNEGTRIRVSVGDDGVGLPADFEPARSKTLGLQLVSDLAKQLDGVLLMKTEGGTEVAVTFAPG